MSGKRHKKKEEQRAGALEQRLADLYRRQADVACLDLVHERGRDLALERLSPARYREAADRALRRALAGADWQGVGRILKRLRRDIAGALPLVELAESVRQLVEGPLDEARAGLATLTAERDGLPPGLVTSLTALASGQETPGGERHVRDLARRMDLLGEQGFRIGTHDIRVCEVALLALELAIVADRPARQLLEAARSRLRLLESLTTLERDLLRDLEDSEMRILGPFLEEMREHWLDLTQVLRAEPPWNLVRPLHYAVRLAWRGLLQLVAGREGPAAWGTLYQVWPELLSIDLESETGAEGRTLETDRRWREWNDLLARRRYCKLAEFLEAKSRSEKNSERLADLWEAELWACQRSQWTEPEADPRPMDRLERMTAELGRRIPPGERPEVARRLRNHLVDLCELEEYSRRFLEVAKALLIDCEDDPALLAIALASAVCSRDETARDFWTERIVARGAGSGEDMEDVLDVVFYLAMEEWSDIAETLPRLRPLLEGEPWERAVRMAARGIAEEVLRELSDGWDDADLESLRQALESARRTAPDLEVLATLERAVACLGAGEQAPGLVRRHLEENPSLDEALLLAQVLAEADPLEPGMKDALAEARAGVTDRLDRRWARWSHPLRPLFEDASPEEIRRVQERLQALLRSEDLEKLDRSMIQEALDKVTDLELAALRRDGLPVEPPSAASEPESETTEGGGDAEFEDETWDEPEDWEDDDEDLPPPPPDPPGRVPLDIEPILERLFPPPHLVMKPLGPAPEPLQEKDLEPLLRPLRRQAVEEVLRAGLGGR